MSCPICGANCRCRKRGPGGICCSCHRHKARRVLDTFKIPMDASTDLRRSLEWHLENQPKGELQAELAFTNQLLSRVL